MHQDPGNRLRSPHASMAVRCARHRKIAVMFRPMLRVVADGSEKSAEAVGLALPLDDQEYCSQASHAALMQGCRAVIESGRPRGMTREKLHYAQSLMADRTRSIPEICREQGGIRAGTLYHYLYADRTFKEPGRKLL